MIIWYKNFIVVEKRDKELEFTISICDAPRQRDSVSSMDTDLDSIKEDFRNGFDDVIENLINAKVYSSKEALEDDIKNGKLRLYAEAQYIDSNK